MVSRSKCIAWSIVGSVVLLAAAILIAISMETIQTYEVGVAYDTAGFRLDDNVRREGLYALAPGSDVIRFPNVFKVMSFTGSNNIKCINYDGVEVTLDVTYQFRPQEDKVVELIEIYREYENYEELLKLVGKSAILDACNEFNTYDSIARRADFTNTAKSKMAAAYKKIGCDVSGLQVDNIARPAKYDQAMRAKEAAREKSVVKLNERKTKLVEANTKLSEEEADAEISVTKAESDARVRIRKAEAEADTIKKWYEVHAEIYRKIIALGFSGQSLLTYLEIDAISNSKQPVFVALDSPVNLTLT